MSRYIIYKLCSIFAYIINFILQNFRIKTIFMFDENKMQFKKKKLQVYYNMFFEICPTAVF